LTKKIIPEDPSTMDAVEITATCNTKESDIILSPPILPTDASNDNNSSNPDHSEIINRINVLENVIIPTSKLRGWKTKRLWKYSDRFKKK
jgi:hypothetical protein